MTRDDAALVRASLESLRPDPIPVVNNFYMRLFAIAPRIRAVFPDEMSAQNRKFADMIDAAVQMIDNPAVLEAELAALGRQHAALGAGSADYALVEEALLWALGRHFGAAFTPQTAAAWQAFYRRLSAAMLQAAAA
ncbi:globin domain-containing protein [Prosthecodimorpha hirschii]|uniref:globin domain-containing protein n=1 Tax=Prosthecodimorpha hirschii TaxID=665126 RepID=UPI0015E34A48|nr:globin domain-containing protein [Prosthecomicrobium hirschii]